MTGLALGAIYVLSALGLSLIFGMLNIVSFAHGAFYVVGAYVGAAVLTLTGSFVAAVISAFAAGYVAGALSEWLLVRRLYGQGINYPLLLTFGLAYVLVDVVRMIFGREGTTVATPAVLRGAIDLGFGAFPIYRVFLIVFTACILSITWFAIERTNWGLIIRAGSRDSSILRILGIDVSRVWLITFGLGTALAALAGILAAPIRGANPEMGGSVLAEAFVVTVLGGMGSLAGTAMAGCLAGLVVSMTTLFAPEFADLSLYMLMASVLLFSPNGLFARVRTA
jgi:branched-chain amino acid transport system permease protein